MIQNPTLPALVATGFLLLIPGPALADLKVVVTSKPIHSLVSSVMTGVGSPGLLVDGPASPHSYALKPSDARKVHSADVLFRVSRQLEPFTGRLVTSLPNPIRVVSLAETPGLMLLERREGGAFEGDGADGHDEEHGDDEAEAHDPHVWLNPDNAKAMVHHIADVLTELAPSKARVFKANAEVTIARISALSEELAREMAPISGKPFIIYHDAYQYFEKSYGLTAAGTVTVNPDLPPSGKRLQQLRKKIETSGALCVFAEPHFNPRVIEVVVEGTQARTGTLDPEGTRLTPGPELYPRLMRDLARNLNACLAGE